MLEFYVDSKIVASRAIRAHEDPLAGSIRHIGDPLDDSLAER